MSQAVAVAEPEIDVGFGRAVDPGDYDAGIASERLFDDPLAYYLSPREARWLEKSP